MYQLPRAVLVGSIARCCVMDATFKFELAEVTFTEDPGGALS
jgi:hypothetical protein